MRSSHSRRAVPAGIGVLTVLLMAGCSHPAKQAQAPLPAASPTNPSTATNPPPPVAPSPSDQPPAPPTVGQPAPEFATETTTGKPISLESLRGKVVLVDYWATWCGPCKMAMPTLESLHRKYGDQGLEVLGISVDAADTVAHVPAVARSLGVTYTLSASPDNNNRAQLAYGVQGIPVQFLIDKKGVLRWNMEGIPTNKEIRLAKEQQLKTLIEKLLAEPA